MKKCMMVMVTLLYIFIGSAMLFAANTLTQKADVGGIKKEAPVGFFSGNKGYTGTGLDYTHVNNDLGKFNPGATPAAGMNLYASFTGYGIYKWDGSAWSFLTPTSAAIMVASGQNLYASFTDYGVYKWDGSAWSFLTPTSAAIMVASGQDLYASFTGYGIYKWDGSAWSFLTPTSAAIMVASGQDLYASFTGYGVYKWDGSAWSFLTPTNAAIMVTTSVGDYTSATIGILKYVPAGSFQRDGTPANISTITTPFRMSQYEITRAQFLAVMGVDPSDATYSTGMTDPVQQVSWYAAIAFCNKLSIAEGLTPVYYVEGVNFSTLTYGAIPTTYNAAWNAAVATWTNNGYRLPTEMEWMWAAMGATSGSGYAGPTYLTGYGKLFAGNDSILANGSGGSHVIGDYAWIWENTDAYMKSHPVGTTGGGGHANELGLYDMSGNVWEWCWDLYASYPSGTLSDFRGAASGMYRSQRGDSWSSLASNMAVAVRSYGSPHVSWNRLGLRVVRP